MAYARRSNSYARSNSDDPDELTAVLVNDFKRVVQSKIRSGARMTESDVEAEVGKIRCSAHPDQCNFDRWKKDLPRDLRSCSKAVLTASMAYGNNPGEVQSIIETKMNDTNSDGDTTDTSLDNIISPLKRLKKELDRNKSPNLFKSIRDFDNRNINCANRLFFIEARHFAPGAKDYSYVDAQNAVKAIRETDCENDEPDVLLPIIKTFDNTDDIRNHLKKVSQRNKGRNESPSRESSSFDDDHTPTSPSIINSSTTNKNNPDHDTSNFHIKPLENPYSSKPSVGGTSGRFSHLPQDVPTQSFSGTRPPRK
jgi:hypothetical protein